MLFLVFRAILESESSKIQRQRYIQTLSRQSLHPFEFLQNTTYPQKCGKRREEEYVVSQKSLEYSTRRKTCASAYNDSTMANSRFNGIVHRTVFRVFRD